MAYGPLLPKGVIADLIRKSKIRRSQSPPRAKRAIGYKPLAIGI